VLAAGGQLIAPTFDVMQFGRMFVATDTVGGVFAVWQAKEHNGAAVYNEHGAYGWNELHTRDSEAAKKFYGDVFGFTYTEFDFGDAAYVTFTPPTRTEGVGGIADESGLKVSEGGAADNMPSYWLVWFQHDDVDAAVAMTTELGGRVLQAVSDTPAGRSAVIAGPQGEAIGIIDPSKAVGEMPAPKA